MPISLSQTKTRLLTSGLLVAAGTIGGVDGVLPLAGKLLAGTVAGLAQNLLADDVMQVMASHIGHSEEALHNHHLTRAVGEAIATVIHLFADEPEMREYRTDLRRFARKVCVRWEQLIGSPSPPPSPVQEAGLVDLFRSPSTEASTVTVLSPEEWQRLAERLAREQEHSPRDIYLPATVWSQLGHRLYARFVPALREVLKHDFVHDGKAYASLLLLLLGDMSEAVERIEAHGRQQDLLLVERFDDLKRTAQQEIQAGIQQGKKELLSALEGVTARTLNRFFLANAEAQKQLVIQLAADQAADRVRHEELSERLTVIQELIQTTQTAASALPQDRLCPNNLPIPTTPLLGRDAEMSAWLETLRRPTTRLVTLTGFGGIGKTRVALELAMRCSEDHAEEFPDGVWWLDLSEVQEPEAFYEKITRVMGLASVASRSQEQQVEEFLQNRKLLFVLDSPEQILAGASPISRLLAAGRWVRCLVASRHALGLRGEILREVPPLTLPPAPSRHSDIAATAETWSTYGAITLFVHLAQARDETFLLSNESLSAVVEICRRLEGIPMAIELAAARISTRTPHEILARLNVRLTDLQEELPELPPRLRAMGAAIDWSYQLLDKEDQRLLLQLSIFAGGFLRDQAVAICDGQNVEEGIERLRARSLLRTQVEGERLRFRMLDLLREYAEQKKNEERDCVPDDLYYRHAEYFLAFGEEQSTRVRTESEATALRELDADIRNLHTAMDWSLTQAKPALTARLALVIGRYNQRCGWATTAVRAIRTGLNALDGKEEFRFLRAELLRELSSAQIDLLQWSEAQRSAMQARDLYEIPNNPFEIANTWNLLGLAALGQGKYAEARSRFDEAENQFAEAEDRIGVAIARNNRGLVEYYDDAGSLNQAASILDGALRLRYEIGDWRGVAETLSNQGIVAQKQDEWQAAWDWYSQSLAVERKLKHQLGIARALCNLGEVAETGRISPQPDALRLFLGADQIFQQLASPHREYTSAILERLVESTAYTEEEVRLARQQAATLDLDDLTVWAYGATPIS